MYSNVVRALGARRLIAAGALFALVAGSSATAFAGAVSITAPSNRSTVSGEVTINLTLSSSVWWTRLAVDKVANVSGYNPLVWDSSGVSAGKHTLTVTAYKKGGTKAIGTASMVVYVSSDPTPTPSNTSTPTPTPIGTSTPSSTATPSGTPTPVSYFSTQPYSASLPTDQQCAAEIATTSETASWNTPFNQTVPTSSQLSSYASNGYVYGSVDDLTQYKRVDGQYTGSTDMIMRWAACKYGIDENVVRAQAWVESEWEQGGAGDEQFSESACVQGNFTALWNTSITEPGGTVISVPNGCYQSWSAWQTKVYYAWMTWPEIMESTAFGADYRYADQRACMDGAFTTYFQSSNQQPNTYATDLANYQNNPSTANTNQMLWGCIGQHYSGSWYDSGAQSYISAVQSAESSEPWPH